MTTIKRRGTGLLAEPYVKVSLYPVLERKMVHATTEVMKDGKVKLHVMPSTFYVKGASRSLNRQMSRDST